MKKNAQMEAIIFRVDGSYNRYTPENGKTFELEEAQDIVGGYIEVVSWFDNGKKIILIINSEGKIEGLAPNVQATMLARSFNAISPYDYIVGDAIMCPSKMLP